MDSPIRWKGRIFLPSSGFDDFTGGYATGADHDLLGPPVVHGAHALQIGLETAFGHVVCMTDVAAHHGLFPTYFAYFSHQLVSTGSNFLHTRRRGSPGNFHKQNSLHMFIFKICKAFCALFEI
jgi:hypothetical protein